MHPVQIDQPETLPPRHRPFRLSWLMLVPVAIVAALQWQSFSAAHPGANVDRAVGHVTGSMIGLVLGSLLFAWIAWVISRRSRRAANYTFAISVLLLGLATVSMRGAENALASKAVGTQLAGLREKRVAAEEAQKKLVAAGGVDIRLPRDADDVAARMALVEEADAKVREFLDAGDGAAAELATKLNDPAITPERRKAVVAEFEQRVNWRQHRAVLVALQQTLARGRELLAFLHDQRGRWSVDVEKDEVVFVSDADAERFNALSSAFADSVEKFQRMHPGPATRSAAAASRE